MDYEILNKALELSNSIDFEIKIEKLIESCFSSYLPHIKKAKNLTWQEYYEDYNQIVIPQDKLDYKDLVKFQNLYFEIIEPIVEMINGEYDYKSSKIVSSINYTYDLETLKEEDILKKYKAAFVYKVIDNHDNAIITYDYETDDEYKLIVDKPLLLIKRKKLIINQYLISDIYEILLNDLQYMFDNASFFGDFASNDVDENMEL